MADVLIIDDDARGAAALARMLQGEGHQADCAASAGAALSLLRKKEPDLVLLDLSMPRVDGLDLLDALTDEPRFSRLRIAVYSGRTEPEALNTARKLGACDYIIKGGDWDQLYNRIRPYLAPNSPPPEEPSPGLAAQHLG